MVDKDIFVEAEVTDIRWLARQIVDLRCFIMTANVWFDRNNAALQTRIIFIDGF